MEMDKHLVDLKIHVGPVEWGDSDEGIGTKKEGKLV